MTTSEEANAPLIVANKTEAPAIRKPEDVFSDTESLSDDNSHSLASPTNNNEELIPDNRDDTTLEKNSDHAHQNEKCDDDNDDEMLEELLKDDEAVDSPKAVEGEEEIFSPTEADDKVVTTEEQEQKASDLLTGENKIVEPECTNADVKTELDSNKRETEITSISAATSHDSESADQELINNEKDNNSTESHQQEHGEEQPKIMMDGTETVKQETTRTENPPVHSESPKLQAGEEVCDKQQVIFYAEETTKASATLSATDSDQTRKAEPPVAPTKIATLTAKEDAMAAFLKAAVQKTRQIQMSNGNETKKAKEELVVADKEEHAAKSLQKTRSETPPIEEQASFGSRYKNGLIAGLSLETEDNSFQNVKGKIAAINRRCSTGTSNNKPQSQTQLGAGGGATTYNKTRSGGISYDRKRRASTGELVRPLKVDAKATTIASESTASAVATPRGDSKKLLKTYNKDLFYTDELNRLIDIDPADDAQSKALDFDAVKKIVSECPSVCRAKFDLTFNKEKLNLYPIFSLVAHNAPLDIIRMVFFENPFRIVDTRDVYGQTLMHYACAFNPPAIETLQFLIHRGAHSLDSFDKQKRTPVHTACANKKSTSGVLLFLLNESPHSVAITYDNAGMLPLDLAKQNLKCYVEVKNALNEKAEAHKEEEREKREKEENAKKQVLEEEQHRDAELESLSFAPSPRHVTASSLATGGSSAPKPQTATDGRSTPELPKPSFWERLCCVPHI